MHPFDVIIVISAATAVGYIASIYVENDAGLVIGYMVFSLFGAFAVSLFALEYLPHYGKIGILFGALLGAVVPTLVWGFLRKRRRSKAPPLNN